MEIPINIHVFGNRYHRIGDFKFECFSAKGITNMELINKFDMNKITGFDPLFLKEVEKLDRMKYIEKHIKELLEDYPSTKDIGIYCQQGRHRSVANGEPQSEAIFINLHSEKDQVCIMLD